MTSVCRPRGRLPALGPGSPLTCHQGRGRRALKRPGDGSACRIFVLFFNALREFGPNRPLASRTLVSGGRSMLKKTTDPAHPLSCPLLAPPAVPASVTSPSRCARFSRRPASIPLLRLLHAVNSAMSPLHLVDSTCRPCHAGHRGPSLPLIPATARDHHSPTALHTVKSAMSTLYPVDSTYGPLPPSPKIGRLPPPRPR